MIEINRLKHEMYQGVIVISYISRNVRPILRRTILYVFEMKWWRKLSFSQPTDYFWIEVVNVKGDETSIVDLKIDELP